MKIAIASDHGGIEMKKQLLNFLIEEGKEVVDCSPENNETDDYPDFAINVCQKIQTNDVKFGILICRSGIGMSIAANKMRGIYCARVVNISESVTAREHNGANVISLDSDMNIEIAKEIVNNFLSTTSLNDERHERRYKKIIRIENGEYNV